MMSNRHDSDVEDHTRVHHDFLSRLIRCVRPAFVDLFRKMFRCADRECRSTSQDHLVLVAMQRLLMAVPTWPVSRLQEVRRSVLEREPHVDDLIQVTFTSRVDIYRRCYQDRIVPSPPPDPIHFFHAVLIRCARNLYRQPHRLHDDTNPTIRRENYRLCDRIVAEAVRQTVGDHIPAGMVAASLPPHPITTARDAVLPPTTTAAATTEATPSARRRPSPPPPPPPPRHHALPSPPSPPRLAAPVSPPLQLEQTDEPQQREDARNDGDDARDEEQPSQWQPDDEQQPSQWRPEDDEDAPPDPDTDDYENNPFLSI